MTYDAHAERLYDLASDYRREAAEDADSRDEGICAACGDAQWHPGDGRCYGCDAVTCSDCGIVCECVTVEYDQHGFAVVDAACAECAAERAREDEVERERSPGVAMVTGRGA